MDDFIFFQMYSLFMKFRLSFKYLIICLISLSVIQPVKADLASDLLKMAGDASAKNKAELSKWGLKSSKDIKKLKSKEIISLLEGNIVGGTYNDNTESGPTEDTYYTNGTYKSQAGREKGKWKVKNGQLCYNPGGCVKVYRSIGGDIPVYFLKKYGILYTKFTYVVSIEERKLAIAADIEERKLAIAADVAARGLEKEKLAKEKKLSEEKLAKAKASKEKKLAQEKRIAQEKIIAERKAAKEKVAKERLNKKLSLIPPETELEKAQNFLINIQEFIKRSPNVFDIVKISEFFIRTKLILEGTMNNNLKNEIKLFKEFTNSSSSFVFYINQIEKKRIDEELTKIDETLLVLERNIKTLEQFMISDPNSIYLEESVVKIKKAKKIFNDPSNFEQLLIATDDLKNLISIKQEIIKQRNYSSIFIQKLKEYLTLNLTTDLAPLIIEKIKLLEISAKKESAEDLISANQIAKKFIYTTFVEPEEKRIAEDERIAEEKRAKEIRKNRILGMECSDLQKQNTGEKLSNSFGKEIEILYIDDPKQSFRDDNNLECIANAKLSDARNVEIKMKIYRENDRIFTGLEVLD